MSALDVTLHKVRIDYRVVDAWLWACALEFEGHKHLMMASQCPIKAPSTVWRFSLPGVLNSWGTKEDSNLMFLFCKVFPYSLVDGFRNNHVGTIPLSLRN